MTHLLVLLLEAERRGIFREWFAPLRRWVVDTAMIPHQAVTDWSRLVQTIIWCLIAATTAYVLGSAWKASKG